MDKKICFESNNIVFHEDIKIDGDFSANNVAAKTLKVNGNLTAKKVSAYNLHVDGDINCDGWVHVNGDLTSQSVKAWSIYATNIITGDIYSKFSINASRSILASNISSGYSIIAENDIHASGKINSNILSVETVKAKSIDCDFLRAWRCEADEVTIRKDGHIGDYLQANIFYNIGRVFIPRLRVKRVAFASDCDVERLMWLTYFGLTEHDNIDPLLEGLATLPYDEIVELARKHKDLLLAIPVMPVVRQALLINIKETQ